MFYNLIYGEYLYENGQNFLTNYAEKSGSTGIIETPREIPIPEYFNNYRKSICRNHPKITKKNSIIFRGGYDKGYKIFIVDENLFVCILIYFNKNIHFQ